MTHEPPKAFDFGEEAPPEPARRQDVPHAFDFGNLPDAQQEAPPAAPPKALSFDDVPAAPSSVPVKAAARALFESEDHPAVRDALATAAADHPALFEHSGPELARLFRRLLPIKLALVTQWAERPLGEQAALLQPITALVLQFTQLGVPALLEAALESTRATPGMFGKLFRRQATPADHEPALSAARTQLLQLMTDSEVAMRNLERSAHSLTLHGAALAVVAHLADDAADATLLDALAQRRTLIQQAVRQAELSILQMGQVRQQAVDLVGQIAAFLTVTLPAIQMARAQGRE